MSQVGITVKSTFEAGDLDKHEPELAGLHSRCEASGAIDQRIVNRIVHLFIGRYEAGIWTEGFSLRKTHPWFHPSHRCPGAAIEHCARVPAPPPDDQWGISKDRIAPLLYLHRKAQDQQTDYSHRTSTTLILSLLEHMFYYRIE
jgi:hypothetical protein